MCILRGGGCPRLVLCGTCGTCGTNNNLQTTHKKIQEQLDIASEQKKDETLRLVREWIVKKEKPRAKDTTTSDRDVKCYRDIYETLYIKNDIIWRRAYRGEAFKKDRICIPTNLQEEIINRTHSQDLAHFTKHLPF